MPSNHHVPHTPETREKIRKARIGVPNPSRRRETKIINGEIFYKCGTCKQFKPYNCFYKENRTLLGIKSNAKHVIAAPQLVAEIPKKQRLPGAELKQQTGLVKQIVK